MQLSVSLDPCVYGIGVSKYLPCVNKADNIAIHCDVMDGKFDARKAMTLSEYKHVLAHAEHPIDVHLMIVNPRKHIKKYINNKIAEKPRSLVFHIEMVSQDEACELLQFIRLNGIKAGIAIDMGTEITHDVGGVLALCDVVVLMTVKAGKSGQIFTGKCLEKVSQIRHANKSIKIIVDGGINKTNINEVRESGVDVAVVGSVVYNAEDTLQAIKELQKLCD